MPDTGGGGANARHNAAVAADADVDAFYRRRYFRAKINAAAGEGLERLNSVISRRAGLSSGREAPTKPGDDGRSGGRQSHALQSSPRMWLWRVNLIKRLLGSLVSEVKHVLVSYARCIYARKYQEMFSQPI